MMNFLEIELPESIGLNKSSADCPIYEIHHPTCKARITAHGAQVLSWKPSDEEEVLYLSPMAVFGEGKAIRGGVPICWPWFNSHPTDPDLPSHGIARTRVWNLVAASEHETGVKMKFEMSEGIWHASVTISIGESLELNLETRNPNEIPIVYSGALHPYFTVSDISNVRIVNLDGSAYLDTVAGETRRTQKGAVKFHGEVDAIYDSNASVLLVDEGSGRTLLIEKTGSPSTVIWNPWMEKSASLTDLPDDAYRKFCCVESAIANDMAVIVMPGTSAMLGMKISVEE